MAPFLDLLKRSFTDPRGAVRAVIELGIRREALWMALILVALLNAIFYSVMFQFGSVELPPDITPEEAAMFGFYLDMARRPIILTMLIAATLTLSVFFFTWVGGMLRGEGSLGDVLAAMTLWQFVGLAVSLVLLLIGLVALPIANLLSFGLNIWLLYMLSAMLAEAHRFTSPLLGLVTIALSVFLVVIGLSIALLVIGAGAGVGGTNV